MTVTYELHNLEYLQLKKVAQKLLNYSQMRHKSKTTKSDTNQKQPNKPKKVYKAVSKQPYYRYSKNIVSPKKLDTQTSSGEWLSNDWRALVVEWSEGGLPKIETEIRYRSTTNPLWVRFGWSIF